MVNIRRMKYDDKIVVREMMDTFYHSPAVMTDGSSEIYDNDIDACISDNPYLEGYVFECEDNVIGYGMLAKSFSTEFGRQCIWIEDIYVIENYRSRGVGTEFFDYINEKYKGCLIRLEVEKNNLRAVSFYKRNGFEEIPYMEMKKTAGDKDDKDYNQMKNKVEQRTGL